MREIKFRVWHKGSVVEVVKDGKPTQFFLPPHMEYYFNPVMHGEFNIFDFSFLELWEKGGYVPMQFSGLHDKNGKEIYEGDIVEMDWGLSIERREIVFQPGAGFGFKHCPDACDIFITDLDQYRSAFIIGNIYENPELLEKA
jgi:hypothetical protein